MLEDQFVGHWDQQGLEQLLGQVGVVVVVEYGLEDSTIFNFFVWERESVSVCPGNATY